MPPTHTILNWITMILTSGIWNDQCHQWNLDRRIPAVNVRFTLASCYLSNVVSEMTYNVLMVTGHLSEGSFVRNVVVQIPKFDAKPNPKQIRLRQMTLWTSELSPNISTSRLSRYSLSLNWRWSVGSL